MNKDENMMEENEDHTLFLKRIEKRHPSFFKFLSRTTNELKERLSRSYYQGAIIISHNDADGIISAFLLSRLLKIYFEEECLSFNVFDRKFSWKPFLANILPKFLSSLTEKSSLPSPKRPKILLLICDIGDKLIGQIDEFFSYLNQNYPLIRSLKYQDVFEILYFDHHFMQNPHPFYSHPPSFLRIVNCEEFGISGDYELTTSALIFLFLMIYDPLLFSSYAGFTCIGIMGDNLNHLESYQAYNKDIVEFAIEKNVIKKKKTIVSLGFSYRDPLTSLLYSIEPLLTYRSLGENITSLSLEEKEAFLQQHLLRALHECHIDLNKNIEEIEPRKGLDLARKLCMIPEIFIREQLFFPDKRDLLRFTSDLSLFLYFISEELAEKDPLLASKLFQILESSSAYSSPNGSQFLKIYEQSIILTATALRSLEVSFSRGKVLVYILDHVPPKLWKIIATYGILNHLFPEDRFIMLGGVMKRGKNEPSLFYKFSLRCTPSFADKFFSVNSFAHHLRKRFPFVNVGGHITRGGLYFPKNKLYDVLNFIQELK